MKLKSLLKQGYTRRLRFISKSKLHGRNKINAIKTWPVSVLMQIWSGHSEIDKGRDKPDRPRHWRKKWQSSELCILNVTYVKSIYRNGDGGRGLIGWKDCTRGEENSLVWYVRSSTEPFLIGVKLAGIIKADIYTSKEEFNKNGVGKKTTELKEKVMRRQFQGNRPFPCSPKPQFQSEAKCEVLVMKISFHSYSSWN